MHADLIAALPIGRVVGGNLDVSAVRVQDEMMRRLILVEPHRGRAALLQIVLFLQLGQMLLVGHARRHGRMLRER